MGCPVLPFIDQERVGVIDGRKRKKPKVEKVPWGSQVFLFPCAYPANMVARASNGAFIYPHGVQRAREPSCDPSGSRRGSDHTSITVDDVTSVLDHSGCRMLMLVSASEG